MLTGKELGQAIEGARIKKGVSKKALADHFGVEPPSIKGWIESGRVGKHHLNGLFLYFSDVADLAYWGITLNPGDRVTAHVEPPAPSAPSVPPEIKTVFGRMQHILINKGVERRKVKSTIRDVCKVSYEAVRKWEDNPNTDVGIDKVDLFAEHYDVSFRWLATGKGTPQREYDISSTDVAAEMMAGIDDRMQDIAKMLDGHPGRNAGLSDEEWSIVRGYRRASNGAKMIYLLLRGL